jgi:hypothetical protein
VVNFKEDSKIANNYRVVDAEQNVSKEYGLSIVIKYEVSWNTTNDIDKRNNKLFDILDFIIFY